MSIHWSNIDPKLWDLLALLLCAAILPLGIRLAFWGRIAKARWARLVETLATLFLVSALTNLVLFFTGKPPSPALAMIIGSVAGTLAFFYAERHVPELYGGIVGLVAGGIAAMSMFTLPNPLHWLISVGVVLVAAAIGYKIGVWIYSVRVIAGTALAGAQWTSMACVGLIGVSLDESADFLRDEALAYLLPGFSIVYKMFTDTVGDFVVDLLGLITLLAVLAAGCRYQYRRRNEPIFAKHATLREMLAQIWRQAIENFKKRTVPAMGAVAAYFCIALMLRSIAFDTK